MVHQKAIVQRLLGREVQPPDLPGLFAYTGIDSEEMGEDADNFAWADACKRRGEHQLPAA